MLNSSFINYMAVNVMYTKIWQMLRFVVHGGIKSWQTYNKL